MEPTALETALTAVKTDVIAVVGSVIGIGVAIFAAKWVPKQAIGFFKGITKGN